MTDNSERPGIQNVLASSQARLNRSLRVLFQCNHLLFATSSEHELLQAICQVLIEAGELRLAWIGYCVDDAEKSLRPVAMAGHGVDFLDCVKFTWGETGPGQSPTKIALRFRLEAPVLSNPSTLTPVFSTVELKLWLEATHPALLSH